MNDQLEVIELVWCGARHEVTSFKEGDVSEHRTKAVSCQQRFHNCKNQTQVILIMETEIITCYHDCHTNVGSTDIKAQRNDANTWETEKVSSQPRVQVSVISTQYQAWPGSCSLPSKSKLALHTRIMCIFSSSLTQTAAITSAQTVMLMIRFERCSLIVSAISKTNLVKDFGVPWVLPGECWSI
jgi:hypothetical protein